MEVIGGILGQIIATLNIVLFVVAHLYVFLRERKLKQIELNKAAEIKRRQLREAAFKK